ncbi:hypothetical protein HUB98_06220 [Paenibacillus barcinonensis]|uniref:Uncharacterized protein n=1 Tax=Paenibacillus barcinonensis TaxID=198119 RepID=A0A2V4WHI4_PAEBA|nr:hypothetical protein [Paenibacillus barcinonensis]PYE51610.1 hypothetical protein DFQ00_102405 [Paenibacillus barcinonensis]QKS55976.1 hypothetical protein HUB98_06220 [Paenibacillus barcinonensis]
MLIKKKDVVVGQVYEDGSSFQAYSINWGTGEKNFIGNFDTFDLGKKSVLKYKRGNC